MHTYLLSVFERYCVMCILVSCLCLTLRDSVSCAYLVFSFVFERYCVMCIYTCFFLDCVGLGEIYC